MVPERTRTKIECCRKWEDLDPADRRRMQWQVLHQLAHSRLPFSLERYAELAGVSLVDATALVGVARERSWVAPVSGTRPRLFNGLLPHR